MQKTEKGKNNFKQVSIKVFGVDNPRKAESVKQKIQKSRKENSLLNKNEKWIHDFDMDKEIYKLKTYGGPEIFKNWYIEYKKINGKHDEETFAKNLCFFLRITVGAYTNDGLKPDGTQWTRNQAITCWKQFIKDKDESWRYFRAVDEVTAMS